MTVVFYYFRAALYIPKLQKQMTAASVNAYSRCEKEVKATMRTIYKMYTMAKEQIPTRKLHDLAELQALNVSLK